jgi:hypothetical protein
MKAYLLLPLACLIGYLVGSWGAQDELRSVRAHARESSDRAASKPAGFDTFARMVKIPETAHRSRRFRRDRNPSAPSPIAITNSSAKVRQAGATVGTPRPIAATDRARPEAATNSPPVRLSPEDLRARIEEAQEMWRTRVDIARAQWKAKLKLDADGEKAFDAALQEMNERLYDSVSALAGILNDKPEMTPELGLRLVGESTTILAETYDKIGTCAPGMRETVSTIQMTDFIDPGVAEPLIGVQGKLHGLMPRGRMGR